jgi:hypothetical protein
MRPRDLGALGSAVDAEERPVTGVRATAMLALLTIYANQRVSVDALIDAAWGARATAGECGCREPRLPSDHRLRGWPTSTSPSLTRPA